MNKVVITGNLVDSPTIYDTKNADYKMLSFRIANTEKEGSEDRTTFVQIISGKSVSAVENYFSKYLVKGVKVLVDGRLRQSTYNDKTFYDIFAENIEILKFVNTSPEKTDNKNQTEKIQVPKVEKTPYEKIELVEGLEDLPF